MISFNKYEQNFKVSGDKKKKKPFGVFDISPNSRDTSPLNIAEVRIGVMS